MGAIGAGCTVSGSGTHVDITEDVCTRMTQLYTEADTYAALAYSDLVNIQNSLDDLLVSDPLSGAYSTDLSGVSTAFSATAAAVEPGEVSAPSDPTLHTVATISAFDPGAAPSDVIDVTGEPGVLPASVLGSVDAIGALALPLFTSVVPSIDVDQLLSQYSYVEPTYTALLQTETQAKLQTVLGDGKIVSDAVWDGVWDRAVADIGRVQVGDVRRANSRAASLSMTGMPSAASTVLGQQAAQNAVDGTHKVRWEQATQEAMQRREDLWNAVREGVAFEGMWLEHHEQLAGRALATAAKAHDARIDVHNANLRRFELQLATAAEEVRGGRLELDLALAPLQEERVKLEREQTLIAKDDQLVKRWLGEWSGWQIEKGVLADVLRARIDSYRSKTEKERGRFGSEAQQEELHLEADARAIAKLTQDWQGIAVQGQRIASHLSARVGAQQLLQGNERDRLGYEQLKSSQELQDKWQAFQATLEKARFEVTQYIEVLQGTAATYVGLSGNYLQQADLAMSARADSTINYSGPVTGYSV